MNFIVIADPNALADKLNAVKKYISDITKVAEVSSPEDNGCGHQLCQVKST